MQFITHDEFMTLEQRDPYYKGRWPYFEAAISLIERLPCQSALEIGPYKHPIISGSATLDLAPHAEGLTYRHDAGCVPWPIADKQYDVCVALQVWEHLGDRQREAFREIMRCCRAAVLSFPLNWHCPGDCHHAISKELLREWTLYVEPQEQILGGSSDDFLVQVRPSP